MNARWGLVAAVAVTVFAVVGVVIAAPLHERGWGQPVTGYVNGGNHLLLMPGVLLLNALSVHAPSSPQGQLAAIAMSVGLYFVLASCLAAGWRCLQTNQPPPPHDKPAGAGKKATRRSFLKAATGVVGGGAVAGLGHALLVEPRWLSITRRVVPIRDLPEALDGLVAVQLTDIHHGPWLSIEYVRHVVQKTNDLAPDIILLTGDYVHKSGVYFEPVFQELAQLRARIGTVAVLGNHDWYEGVNLAREGLSRAGIPLIDNDRRVVNLDRRLVSEANEGLALAGIGDLWEDRPDYRKALGGLPPAMPRLLLSHNPDAAEGPALVRGGYRVDLMISGHTHGGQVRIPFLGTPGIPSRYGQKYAAGLVQGPAFPVFVSRGIGVSVLPLRCGVRPEIAVLELRPR